MLMGSGRSGARLLYNSRIFFFLLLPLLQYSQAIVYVDKNFFLPSLWMAVKASAASR